VAPACWSQSDARSEWTRKIVLQLERHKRFPPNAICQTVPREWASPSIAPAIISTELLHSAGFPLLDAEALPVVSRAAPFPQPAS